MNTKLELAYALGFQAGIDFHRRFGDENDIVREEIVKPKVGRPVGSKNAKKVKHQTYAGKLTKEMRSKIASKAMKKGWITHRNNAIAKAQAAKERFDELEHKGVDAPGSSVPIRVEVAE